MTTYKYVNVNAVVFGPTGTVLVELRDSRIYFTSVVKGTWSKRGTSFRIVSLQAPTVRKLK